MCRISDDVGYKDISRVLEDHEDVEGRLIGTVLVAIHDDAHDPACQGRTFIDEVHVLDARQAV